MASTPEIYGALVKWTVEHAHCTEEAGQQITFRQGQRKAEIPQGYF